MKENNLRKVLEKCSKEELIKIVMKASGMTRAVFPWLRIISEIRLGEIEAKIDANLSQGRELTCTFNAMVKNPHNYSNDDVMKVRIALAENHKEWEQLDRKYDRISKELYG